MPGTTRGSQTAMVTSFTELRDSFGIQTSGVCAAILCAILKDYNEDLKYDELDYVCIHRGKNFMTTCPGEWPNQK